MTTAYQTWQNTNTWKPGIHIHMENFLGPVIDILRMWNNIKNIHDARKTWIAEATMLRHSANWASVPWEIKRYMWRTFHHFLNDDFLE